MEITKRIKGDITILDLDGKFLIGKEAEHFRDVFNTLIKEGNTKIVLNFANLSMMDSTGLGELTRSYKAAKENGGVVKLTNLPPRIKEILTVTKLITVFDTYANEEDAVNNF